MASNTLVSQQDGMETRAWLSPLVSVEVSLDDALSPTRFVGKQGKAKRQLVDSAYKQSDWHMSLQPGYDWWFYCI